MRLTNDHTGSLVSFFAQWEHNLLDLEDLIGKNITDEQKMEWLTESVQVNDAFRNKLSSAGQILGAQGQERPYLEWYDQLREFAKETDDVNAEKKANMCKLKANKAVTTGTPNPAAPSTSSTSTAGRGNAGRGPNGGRGGFSAGRGSGGTPSNRYIAPEVWSTWSEEKKQAHIAESACLRAVARANRQASANLTQATAAAASPTEFKWVQVPTNMTVAATNAQPTAAPGAAARPPPQGHSMRVFQSQQQSAIQTAAAQGTPPLQANVNGVTYNMTRANMAKMTYKVTNTTVAVTQSLIDRGANGSIAGRDMMCIDLSTTRFADITGIDDHVMSNLPFGTFAAKILTNEGPAIAIFYEYAYGDQAATIHSAVQIEDFGNQVFDKPSSLGGRQLIITLEGQIIPLSIVNGLVHLPMEHFTEDEYLTLPHIVMTSDMPWDASKYNGDLSDEELHDEVEQLSVQDPYEAPTLFVNNTEVARTARIAAEHYKQYPVGMAPPDNADGNWEYIDDVYNRSHQVLLPRFSPQEQPVDVMPFIASVNPQSDDNESVPSLVSHNSIISELRALANRQDADSQASYFDYSAATDAFDAREINIYRATVAAKNDSYSMLAGRPARTVLPTKPDYDQLRPYFGFIPTDRIRETIRNTTQFYRAEKRYPPHRHLKSRFPGANVRRLPKKVATDTMFSDTPALDDGIAGHGGCTAVQLYVCLDSRYIRAYPMSSKAQLPSTLLQFINDCGAPLGLVSDGAKEAISLTVQDIERQYNICSHHISKPENQNQNPAERVISDVERLVNVNMDRTGSPTPMWLLCTLHIVALLCLVAQARLGGMTPHQQVFGEVPDISPYLNFHWFQKVRYSANSTSLDTTNERPGYFVGVATNVGDHLTYWVMDADTHQVVARSIVAARQDALNPNLRLGMPNISATDEGGMVVYTEDGLESEFNLASLEKHNDSSPESETNTEEAEANTNSTLR